MDIGSLLNQTGGVSAIAKELGVDEATVERGAGALLPHVADGVETRGLPQTGDDGAVDPRANSPTAGTAGLPGGPGGMLGSLMEQGGGTGALGSLMSSGIGNQILGHIFGSKDTSRDVAAQASQQSGVAASVLEKLLPIVAGAVAMHYARQRGQGDAGTAAPNGELLGSILGG